MPIAGPGSGDPISTHDIQALCNSTYAKHEDFLPAGADGPVYKPFTDSFKSTKRNNWRNSFDLQRGIGCDAPFSAEYLQSPLYLREPRFYCVFRDSGTGRCSSPAGLAEGSKTCFNPAKRRARAAGPESRARPAPKLLSRTDGPDGPSYWCVEPTTEALFDLLGPPERRAPLYPFIVALYGGSPYFGQWSGEISRSRFEADIRLSAEHLATLFDPDPDAELNSRVLAPPGPKRPTKGGPPRRPSAPAKRPSLSKPVRYRERSEAELVERSASESDPVQRLRLLEKSRRGHKRALDALAAYLGERDELTLDEQLDGFDLVARAGNAAMMFEVKTWTPANFTSQVRGGWAQLHEYRYRNREWLPADVKLYLVFDRRPPAESWVWDFLIDDRGVIPAWIEDGGLSTVKRCRSDLP
jgi:hypothetical protein